MSYTVVIAAVGDVNIEVKPFIKYIKQFYWKKLAKVIKISSGCYRKTWAYLYNVLPSKLKPITKSKFQIWNNSVEQNTKT